MKRSLISSKRKEHISWGPSTYTSLIDSPLPPGIMHFRKVFAGNLSSLAAELRAWSPGCRRILGKLCQPGAHCTAEIPTHKNSSLGICAGSELAWAHSCVRFALLRHSITSYLGRIGRQSHTAPAGCTLCGRSLGPRLLRLLSVREEATVCFCERSGAVSLLLMMHLVFRCHKVKAGKISPGCKFTLHTLGALEK